MDPIPICKIIFHVIKGTASTTFNNLTINNTSTTGVVLGINTYISGNLDLTDGYLFSSTANTLIINDNATSSEGSLSSFVDGPVRKVGDEVFVFPVGDDIVPVGEGPEDKWARIKISAPATSTTSFTAKYSKTEAPILTPMAASPTPILAKVSTMEYWTLDRAVTTDAVTVTLYWEDAEWSGITDCSAPPSGDLCVARWNGSAWENCNPTGGSTTGSCSGSSSGSVTSEAVANFSPFTFGAKGINPLPVEISTFNLECLGQANLLTWSTASETNNEFFIIEKSNDGIDYTSIGKVTGAGISTEYLQYSFIDENKDANAFGETYYRLMQVDYDGKFLYSDVIKGDDCSDESETFKMKVYPNPLSNHQKLFLNINSSEASSTCVLVVYNSNGDQVYSDNIYIKATGTTQVVIDFGEQYNSGLYYVVLNSNNNTISDRVLCINY